MINFKLGEENHAENMMNYSALLNAQSYVEGGGDEPVLPNISADSMRRWNKLIDFSKAKGYAGKPELDHDDKLRRKVFDEFNKANPNDAIPIDTVKAIQNEIQTYKQQAIQNIKTGKGEFAGKPEDFMKNISQVDGIFGQLTSNFSFPSAYIENKRTGEKTKLGFAPKVDLAQLK